VKYTIEGFSQAELIRLGLDNTDAVILRFFVDFFASGEMKMLTDNNGDQFAWIKYEKAISELPCTGIKTTDGMSRRFKKLVDCGVLLHHHYKVGGSYSTYRMGPKYRALITSAPTDEKSEGYGSKVGAPTDEKSEQTIHLPEDSSTRDIELIPRLPTKDQTEEILDYLNVKAGKKYRVNAPRRKVIGARFKEGYTMDDFRTVIDNKVSSWKTDPKMNAYLTPETLFAASHFDNYLNQTNTTPLFQTPLGEDPEIDRARFVDPLAEILKAKLK
jgi:uncharacterized phage protein (TIGR02220 family)